MVRVDWLREKVVGNEVRKVLRDKGFLGYWGFGFFLRGKGRYWKVLSRVWCDLI